MRLLLVLSLALLTVLPAAAKPAIRGPAAAPAAPAALPLHMIAAPGGPGILVCEPTGSGDLAAFGAGCARWLHFVVGGQGELGQTPGWYSVDRARREMHRTDLRLTAADAPSAARMIGLTHLALGTITGAVESATLTYTLWDAGTGKAAGAPLSVKGTEAEIVSRLPGLARQIAGRLGVKDPTVPESVGATPEDLAALGRERFLAWRNVSLKDVDAERELGKILVPATLAVLNYLSDDEPESLPATVAALWKNFPANPLVADEVSRLAPACLEPYRAEVEPAAKRFPNNYLLAQAMARLATGPMKDRTAAATEAARHAPMNPDAWKYLALEISDIAAETRKGKPWDAINKDDQDLLARLYPAGVEAARYATRLDPQNGSAWERLAVAATFGDDPKTADAALWKAIAADPSLPSAYSWGLQMYQPKWYDNPAKLAKVADLAAKVTFDSPAQALAIAETLDQINFDSQAKPLYDQAIAAFRERLSRHPDSYAAARSLAGALADTHQSEESAKWYREAIRINPNLAEPRMRLGYLLTSSGHTDEGITSFREAARAEPNNVTALSEYAINLAKDVLDNRPANASVAEERMATAERTARAALKIDPNSDIANYALGLSLRGRNDEDAIAALRKAVEISPNYPKAWNALASVYITKKQYDDAIGAAKEAVSWGHGSIVDIETLADAYRRAKRWPEAEVVFREALNLLPKSAYARLGLAQSLIGQGKKDEGRAEAQILLQQNPTNSYAARAQKILADNP